MPIIERDALESTPAVGTPPAEPVHKGGSFIATPRMDPTLMQRVRSLFTTELKPGVHVVRKDADGLRYIISITSNAYQDREDETITSKALEEYEASCYPADDVFHTDNTYLWWHDDDIVMGEIVAVNYSTPFLVEVIRERLDPVSKVLFDFAETNEAAGASHRFGYRDEDRTADGTYTRIYKQESTYLPDRKLAANIGTYAGVMKDMASKQSDAWFDKIIREATGGAIKDAAQKMHGRTGELAKELEGLGITHKAAKPAAKLPAEMDAAAEAVEDAAEEIEGETKAAMPADFMDKLNRLMQIYELVMAMADDQTVLLDGAVEMAKAIKALEADKAKSKSYEEGLEQRIAILEKRLSLQGRSVTTEKGTNAEAVIAAVTGAEKARVDGDLVDVPGWGKLKPPPSGSK